MDLHIQLQVNSMTVSKATNVGDTTPHVPVNHIILYAERLGYVLQGVVTPTGAILRGVTQVTCSHWEH